MKVKRFLGLLVVFAMLASLALVRTGRLWGEDFRHKEAAVGETPSVEVLSDGAMVVNTTEAGKKIAGYAGPVPLRIFISEGRVDSVSVLANQETPSFFRRVTDAGLPQSWNGMTVEEAMAYTPDAVSGATYSSQAVIGNMRAGLALAGDAQAAYSASEADTGWGVRAVIVFAVILCGAVVPLIVKGRRVRIVQQFLNAGVLGFWAGTFIDFTNMIDFAASGVRYTAASLTLLLMLVVAFLYPLFGKSGHYCNHICPLGSLQELAGHVSRRKLPMGKRVVKYLGYFRELLFSVLMLLLWVGIGAEWIDYELFTGFVVESASVWVLAAGGAFVLLSVFVPRPFCRFVCPTGTLLKL